MNSVDDLQVSDYQDDLDTDPGKIDRVTHEQTDNLADRAGIPPQELAREFEKMEKNDEGNESEDMREHLEDLDEDEGRLKSATK